MATARGKRIRWVAAVAALGLVLAACGKSSTTTSVAGQTGTTGTTGASGATASPTPTELTKVDVIGDWIFDVGFGGLAYGLQQGYFQQHGVDLNFIPGRGSDLAMQQINQGKVDFAFTDLSTYLQQKIKGDTDTTAVFAWMNTPIIGILSLKPINDPQDMAGKTFATVVFSSGKDTLPYVLQQNGVDAKSVKVQLLDFSVLYPELFQGKVDTAEADFAGSYESAYFAAKKAHIKTYFKLLSDWGFKDYGKLLIVSNDLIQSDPDLVRNVVAGFNDSITNALANADGEEIFNDLKQYNPQTDEEQTVLAWKDLQSILHDPGPIDDATVTYLLGFLATQGIKTDQPASSFYDNQYIPTS